MRYHIWCAEVGIGYLLDIEGQPVSQYPGMPLDYPQEIVVEISANFRLTGNTLRPVLESLIPR